VDWASFSTAREEEIGKEFQARAMAREAELRTEYQDRMRAMEAQFKNDMRELQDRLRAKEAEFQAYRDWVAPRNVGRRITRKLRQMLLGR
jgi:hypothetical protein